MTQGYVVDSAADTITFNDAPVAGANNIVITETATASINATDVWAFGAWNPGFGYPAEVEFFSDRLFFACTTRNPQTLWASKTGQYIDHGRSVPLVDEDAITITINARQVNAIRELIPLTELMVLTTTVEWKLTTGADEVVAPGKVGFKPQTFWGASSLPAVVVGESALMVARNGSTIRDIAFEFTDDKYKGNDLSIYAAHLFEGVTVVDLAFQQNPYSCLWLVLSSGELVSLTYVREQEVIGWAKHTTDGLVKRICTVPEGGQDVVYLTVLRTVGGTTRLHTERLAPRNLIDQRDGFFVDAGLTFDGRAQAGTVTLTGGINWLPEEVLYINTSVAFFTGATDVGDQIRLRIPRVTDVNGESVTVYDTVRAEITAYTGSATQALGRVVTAVPAAFQGTAISDWEILRDTIGNLSHLEGKTVAVLADAAVQAQKVVTAGSILLDTPAAVVHVGLPYRSLLESLDINVPGQETVRDKFKLIRRVALQVKDTRGCKAGPDTSYLDEFKVREFENYEDPLALVTGILDVNTTATMDINGRFMVVQDDPLPVTILGMIPDLYVGGSG